MDTQDKENKSITGLEILSEFFSNLDSSEALQTDKKGNPIVDISWFFTENLPREIIQKTVSRLIQESNPNYSKICKHHHKKPEDISSISIRSSQEQTSFMFLGADDWSKLKVLDKLQKTDHSKIPALDIKKFKNEICKTIISEPNPDYTPFLKGIDETLDTACKNFVNYYKYLLKEQKEHSTYSCLVSTPDYQTTSQRKHTNNKIPSNSYERKSKLIPFHERSDLLERHKPLYKINISQKHVNGDIEHNTYISYVYSDLLDGIQSPDKGYLFICEPLSGEQATKLFYMSPEDCIKFPKKNITSNFDTILKEKLELPLLDFISEKGNLSMSHTDLNTYADKIDFYIHGNKGKSMNVLKIYQERLKKLYNNPNLKLPYYTPKISSSDIATLGLGETGKIDRTAQETINNLNEPSNNITK